VEVGYLPRLRVTPVVQINSERMSGMWQRFRMLCCWILQFMVGRLVAQWLERRSRVVWCRDLELWAEKPKQTEQS
jgi:hypothetical protein